MGWLIAAAVLTALAVLPLGLSARYGAEGVSLRIIGGPFRFTLLPSKKKGKEKKEPKAKAKEEKPAVKKTEEAPQKGGSVTDFLPLVRTLLDFLGDFRRKLRVNVLEVQLTLAGGDPADLAVNYGKTWAAVGNLEPLLQRIFVIKKKKIDISCDFLGDKTTVSARLDATVTLGRLVGMAVRHGWRAARQYFKIRSKRKGGSKHESKTS